MKQPKPPNLQQKSPIASAIQQNQSQQQFGLQVQTQTIFDPAVVERYERIAPGSAQKILAVLEANNQAERELRMKPYELQESTNTKHSHDNSRRDWMAFGLMLSAMTLSGGFAYLGLYWFSGGTLATIFMYVGLAFFKWRKPN